MHPCKHVRLTHASKCLHKANIIPVFVDCKMWGGDDKGLALQASDGMGIMVIDCFLLQYGIFNDKGALSIL